MAFFVFLQNFLFKTNAGKKVRTTPRSAKRSWSASNCRGYRSKSSPSPNCAGLTNTEATTTSFLARASSTKDKWPAPTHLFSPRKSSWSIHPFERKWGIETKTSHCLVPNGMTSRSNAILSYNNIGFALTLMKCAHGGHKANLYSRVQGMTHRTDGRNCSVKKKRGFWKDSGLHDEWSIECIGGLPRTIRLKLLVGRFFSLMVVQPQERERERD